MSDQPSLPFDSSGPPENPPPDEPARQRISRELDRTLFVEAGAGSGKTTSLVGRVIALVESGVALRDVAAITFTEKAAAELRDRIRAELERRAPHDARCAAAVDDVDGAAISTLHAFAQRLLSEFPVEAGLPPSVEVRDEISSHVDFEDRWADFLDRLLDDEALETTINLALAAGIEIRNLREVAVEFNRNWDLVQQRVPETAPEPEDVDLSEWLARLQPILIERGAGAFDDKLGVRIDEIEAYAAELEARTDPEERLVLLGVKKPSFKVGRLGAVGGWPEGYDRDGLRDDIRALGEARDDVAAAVREACVHRLAIEIRRFTLEAADARSTEGRLEFHDLLVLARALLTHPERAAGVRRALRDRYTNLLLDEFQDTDPIQVELAVLLTTDPDQTGDWRGLDPTPGRLFFVGDPKQSIYRFRRADIGIYLEARDHLGEDPVLLTTNFRTTAPIIDWVNHVFGHLIEESPRSQPRYVPLDAARTEPAPEGPSVTLLGVDEHHPGPGDGKVYADDLRWFEAQDVVATIRTAIAERWAVRDGDGWRPCRLGDITVLLPARTSLPALERALDHDGVPYRAETSSLVYATREIRDLIATARALDDPTDQVSLLTALRSPVFACGDDDLLTYKKAEGRWDHQAPPPEGLRHDHPVVDAMAYLATLYAERPWLTASEVLGRVVRDRRVLEAGFGGGRPRDLWRRVRFVIDQARAYGESEGGALRDYLRWVRFQAAESARVAETVLPETDDDSVRIMTIHAAKGLEFPITILSGLTTKIQNPRRGVGVVFPPDSDTYGLKLGSHIVTQEFERFQPIDEQMDFHERLRLLYVAATRACDHLVVSVHREASTNERAIGSQTSAALLMAASPGEGWVALEPADSAAWTAPEPPEMVDLPERATWLHEIERVMAASGRRRTIAATTVASLAREAAAVAADPGLAKHQRDLDLPAWQKGRYGTAVGRAVHGVLQSVDLATGAGIDTAAAAQAAAEGILGREGVVADLARSALGSPVVVEASNSAHWREVYVAAPVGETLLEGYVDLLFRTSEGLVVVDYKTDHVDGDDDVDAKVAHYRLQAAAYALAASRSIGEEVVRAAFVFCRPDGSVTREVDDLGAAMAEAEQQVLV